MRSWFSLCCLQQTAVGCRWQTIQLVLTPLMVIVVDKLLNRSCQLFVGIKAIEVVHLTLQDTPEALHV